mmetsp:Transcript_59247/g.120471  ORF Transcript_59247/g.120471 Transcript_59247/m.120471 type:complete len:113 (-) Transcript_59247:37-375(-)
MSEFRMQLAGMVNAARIGVIAAALGGDTAAQWAGLPVPTWYAQNVASNRFGWCMGAWLLGNLIENQVTQTGAFEVYADGQLVFSKLQAGRLPTLNEFLANLDAALGPKAQAQ